MRFNLPSIKMHPFKACSAMSFDECTHLCNYHHSDGTELLHYPHKAICLVSHSPFPSLLPDKHQSFVTFFFFSSRFSYVWNHTRRVYTLLCLASSHLLSMFLRFIMLFRAFWSHVFSLLLILHFMDVPSGCLSFPFGIVINEVAINICIHIFVWIYIFSSCGGNLEGNFWIIQ